jgi:hypothetical protein
LVRGLVVDPAKTLSADHKVLIDDFDAKLADDPLRAHGAITEIIKKPRRE